MAEGKKKKKEKLKAKINTKTYTVEFIKDLNGGSIKKGSKSPRPLSAPTAIDFHINGYVDLGEKLLKSDFPETYKFIKENEEHVKALQAEGKYD